MIVFTHIPRTAGTSFRLVLERALGPEHILSVYGDNIARAKDFVAEQNLNNIKAIRGHVGYGVLPGDHDYVTILRHPMQRLLSLYAYIKVDQGHFAHQQVRAMDFREFVISGVTAETDNGMVRQLCGIEDFKQMPYAHYSIPFDSCGPEQLEQALHNLDEHYVVVGVQERFDAFLLACKERYGWSLSAKVPHANRRMAFYEHVSNEVIQQTITRNMYDLLLWDYARRRVAQCQGL